MSRASKTKGRAGEAEVVRLWRANGWPRARRQPGSGAIRPYGPRDQSPWPFDVGGVDPFVVSVKFDKKLAILGRSGVPGEAFARACLRDLAAWYRHRAVGGETIPVLFGRPGLGEGSNGWRVWIGPSPFFRLVAPDVGVEGWLDLALVETHAVELPWWAFFPLVGTAAKWAA